MDDQISEATTQSQSSEPFIDEITRDQVGKSLGMKDYGEIKKHQDQIKRLIEWAQAKGAKDTTDIVWSIRQLANRVGSPHIGNDWAQHLAEYAYLELERNKIDGQLKEMDMKPGKEEHEQQETNTTTV